MVKNSGFVIYTAPGRYEGLRIGICAGKSLGNAVKRNRLKRQIREIIRQLKKECVNRDMVIIARKGILDKDFSYMKQSLEVLVSRALAQ